ncbi:RDD family protein [Solitalea lacus]|uniref:RDD family protein n=1 Tax=Solitalea lacus TaxID=2911172 RepID=UPI001EDAF92E|nr:RDD family protein [Solitalea lacus]UKJ08951.1 RDD family protein [Solitalea lacus]
METGSATNYQTFTEAQLKTSSYAGFGSRLVACIIDGFILAILTGTLFTFMVFFGIVSFSLADIGTAEDNPAAAFAIIGAVFSLFLIMIAGSWLYHSLLTSSEKQGTIGKQVMGIKVTDLNGNRLSFGRATGRYFSTIITGMIPLFIGYLLAAITEKKQALHDMIASTIVLNK